MGSLGRTILPTSGMRTTLQLNFLQDSFFGAEGYQVALETAAGILDVCKSCGGNVATSTVAENVPRNGSFTGSNILFLLTISDSFVFN